MPTWTPEPGLHWCNGRQYPNGPAESKIWCIRRPPPWYWRVRFSGFAPHWAALNGDHLFPILDVGTGWNPRVRWQIYYGSFATRQAWLEWEANGSLLTNRRLRVRIQDGMPPTTVAIFQLAPVLVVEYWNDFDQVEVPLFVQTGPEPVGDNATIHIRVGTYGGIPAHSCLGDYNGPWP